MAYVDELIAESLKAGHSIDSIVKDFSKSDDPEEKSWATNWINTASKPEYAPGAGIKKEKSLTRMLDFVEENPETAAGIAVATYAATKIPKAVAYYEDRKIKKEELAIKRLSAESYAKQVAAQPLQLSEDLSHADIANMVKTERNVTGKPNPLAASFEEKFKMPLAEAEQLSGGKISNAIDAEIAGNAITKARGFSINPIPGTVSNQPAGIPGAVSPLNQLTNQSPASQQTLKQVVETGGNLSQALKTDVASMVDQASGVAPPAELRTGTGKPAFAGQGPAAELRTKGKKAGEPLLRNSYAKIEDVPAGYAFVPNAQNIDSSRLMIGQPEYTNEYSKRNFPSSYEASILEANEINRALGRPTRAEAKAAGLTLPPQTPGITKSVLESKETPFMGTKTAKVGGILGALIAIPDLVNAQTVGQRGMAGANMLEAVLPPGFTMSNVGEGSSNVPSTANAMLLGSPYAQSPEAKKLRQEQEYVRKVGAGRGIAPPSFR
jgi:hypothetical protein